MLLKKLQDTYKFHPRELQHINEAISSTITRIEAYLLNSAYILSPEESVFFGTLAVIKSDLGFNTTYSDHLKRIAEYLKNFPIWEEDETNKENDLS